MGGRIASVLLGIHGGRRRSESRSNEERLGAGGGIGGSRRRWNLRSEYGNGEGKEETFIQRRRRNTENSVGVFFFRYAAGVTHLEGWIG